jgi:hypothetical protein
MSGGVDTGNEKDFSAQVCAKSNCAIMVDGQPIDASPEMVKKVFSVKRDDVRVPLMSDAQIKEIFPGER